MTTPRRATVDGRASSPTQFVAFLETGERRRTGLFAPDVFCDFTMPTWRLQAAGVEDARRAAPGRPPRRPAACPGRGSTRRRPGSSSRWRRRGTTAASTGTAASCSAPTSATAASPQLSVYCTGDWDTARRRRARRRGHADPAVTRPPRRRRAARGDSLACRPMDGRCRGRSPRPRLRRRPRGGRRRGDGGGRARRWPPAQRFGTFPGRVPALLHEAYAPRVRRAARPAGGRARPRLGLRRRPRPGRRRSPRRRVASAEAAGDAALLADALDAQLLVHWGPDDLAERLRITAPAGGRRRPPDRRRGAAVGAPVAADHRAGDASTCPPCSASCARSTCSPRSPGRRGCGSSPPPAAACTRCSPATSRRPAAAARGASPRARRPARPTPTRSSAPWPPGSPARPATAPRSPARRPLFEEFGDRARASSRSRRRRRCCGWRRAGPDRARGAAPPAGRRASSPRVPRDVDWLLVVTSLTDVAAATGADRR